MRLPEDDVRINNKTCRTALSKRILLTYTYCAFVGQILGVPLATEHGIEDIATKFEQEYVRCVRNEEECVCSAPNCWDTEQRSASQW